MLSTRDINRVVTVWRTVQHIDKQEGGRWGGKSQSKLLLGFVRCENSKCTVRNGVLDLPCYSASRKGFMLNKPEETIHRERQEGVRDVLWEEGFC